MTYFNKRVNSTTPPFDYQSMPLTYKIETTLELYILIMPTSEGHIRASCR